MISGIRATLSGWQRARAEVAQFMREAADEAGALTVGVHEGAGIHPGSDKRDNALREIGVTPPPATEHVATIGAKNHFGSDDIPPRPWLDVGLRKAESKIKAAVKRAERSGDVTSEQLLIAIGKIAQASIRGTLVDIRTPPNSDFVQSYKGGNNPLIDTGTLKDSITYELTDSLPEEGIG